MPTTKCYSHQIPSCPNPTHTIQSHPVATCSNISNLSSSNLPNFEITHPIWTCIFQTNSIQTHLMWPVHWTVGATWSSVYHGILILPLTLGFLGVFSNNWSLAKFCNFYLNLKKYKNVPRWTSFKNHPCKMVNGSKKLDQIHGDKKRWQQTRTSCAYPHDPEITRKWRLVQSLGTPALVVRDSGFIVVQGK